MPSGATMREDSRNPSTRAANSKAALTSMDKLHFDRTDYSVVVKNRAPPPKAWRWEIYRAGNANPIKQSSIYFDTTVSAKRAGKVALSELLNLLMGQHIHAFE
jgi:hypothetical protein